MIIALLAAAGLAGPVLFARHLRHKDVGLTARPEVGLTPAVETKVRWLIKSDPSGVEVRGSDGGLLGNTPWLHEEEAGNGTLQITLRRERFTDVRLGLQRDRSAELTASLLPLPQADPSDKSPRHGSHRLTGKHPHHRHHKRAKLLERD